MYDLDYDWVTDLEKDVPQKFTGVPLISFEFLPMNASIKCQGGRERIMAKGKSGVG
jgi:hypothetical protein